MFMMNERAVVLRVNAALIQLMDTPEKQVSRSYRPCEPSAKVVTKTL
jgi:hypothetical protein